MSFDLAAVRAAYPALGEGYANLDGAAGTLVAAPVADAISAVLRGAVSNRGGTFAPSHRADEIVAAARQAVADLVGGDPAGVAFGPSATALTYVVSRTLAATWSHGDEIVVSRLDHDANVRPWVQAAERAGVYVRWASFDPATGELPAGQYADLVNDHTRLVAVTAASNAIGTIPDVPAIAATAHDRGALVYVDGVHATAHLPIDVTTLGADFYVTSAYKWSGPHIAALVAAPSLLESMTPDKLRPSPDTVPDKFEFGTASFELLAGVTAAVDHLATLAGGATPGGGTGGSGGASDGRRARVLAGMKAAAEYEHALLPRLLDGLAAIPGVSVLPAPERRCPTVSFRVADLAPATVARSLADDGVCVFDGDYYAYEYFTAMGLRDSGGAVRAGIYHYNSAEDIDRLLAGVARLARG